MITELFLVRHGETDWNQQRRIQGLTDIPLNDTGREQARATGRLLARRRWDGVYASPLRRAFETASIIADELKAPEPVPLEALVERNYGDAEGMNFADIEKQYPDRAAVPGQESREAVIERVVPALRELALAHPDQSIVVVSHGGAIRAVLTAVVPEYRHGLITNGSVHSFSFDGEALRLMAFNDPIGDALPGPDGGDLDDQNAVEAREEELA